MWSLFSRDPSKDFAFEVGEPIVGLEDESFWRIHKGKKKGTTDDVTVFLFDVKQGGSTQLDLARSAVKRLKTLRHPNVLTYIDSLETDKAIYLVTETVEPLRKHLDELPEETQVQKQQKDLFIAWGLFQITRGLSFLNNDGNLQHLNINQYSIFVNSAGEWKLAGLEYAVSHPSSSLPTKILPVLERYDPPEKQDISKLRFATKWSVDMWGLGCLIWEVFNGPLRNPSLLKSPGKISKQLVPIYCELVGANPQSRPNPRDVIARCRKPGGYFHNDLVDCLLFLEEIQIKEASDKTKFFASLTGYLDSFPANLSKHKILPQLIHAFDYGEAGSAVLTPLFKLGNLLTEDEYQTRIVPCVVKLFSSPDRTTRARLLQQLEHFAGHLQPATINNQIFPHIINGFMDTNPTIREQTVKSILYLASKLNYNNLNLEVLKHFARLQAKDDQGGIRTNTTVCLGKIAPHLHPQTRQKILTSAFTRALRDPFPPAKIAGLLALAATQGYYPLAEVAERVLPAVCPLTLDPEREVRDQAFRVIKGFLSKLEKVSEDPSLKEAMEAEMQSQSSQVADIASTWAGWAVSAVTSKFYKGQSSQNRETHAGSSPNISATATSSASALGPSVMSAPVLDTPSMSKPTQAQDIWDVEGWRDANTTNADDSTGSGVNESGNEGWDVEEDWAPIEDPHPTNATQTKLDKLDKLEGKSTSNGNSDWMSDFAPVQDKSLKPVSSYNWGDNSDPFEATPKATSRSNFAVKEAKEESWDGWTDNWNAEAGAEDKDEAKRKREEKRLQRQKELEAKRSARQGTALKLGVKKSAD